MKASASVLVVFALICTTGLADRWTSTGTLDATSIGGDNATLETEIIKKLTLPSFTQTVDASLEATEARQVKFGSGSTITREIDGHVYKAGTEMSETLTLPSTSPGKKEFDVTVYQRHELDFNDQNNPDAKVDSYFLIDDPDFEDMINLDLSVDDTPAQIMAEIMRAFDEDASEEGMAIDVNKLRQMAYASHRMDISSDTSNGLTCVWGSGKELAVGRSG